MSRPEKTLTPDRSPLDRFGYELRSWRKGRRLSLAKLAKLVHVSDDTLQKVEVAERRPTTDLVRRCDQALDAAGALVRQWELAESQVATSTAQTDISIVGIAAGAGNPITPRGGDMMGVMPGMAASDEPVTVPCRTPDGRITWMSVPRRTFLIGGLAAVSTIATGATPLATATGSQVEYFRQMRKVLTDSDNLLGPRQVLATVENQIRTMQYLRQNFNGSENERIELLSIQTQFADLSGWLYQDSGNYSSAQFWLDRALEWAHTAGDSETAAFILARKSQLAGDANDSMTTVGLAEAAARIAQSGSRTVALAHTYAGYGHALSGDRLQSERAFERARTLVTEVTDTGLEYGFFLAPSYIEVQHARSLNVLGEHRLAASGFQRAIASLPDGYHRDRGVYLAQEAHAHAAAADVDQAVSVGWQALTIGTQTGSARILTELGTVRNRLEQWRTVPTVSELRDAITATDTV